MSDETHPGTTTTKKIRVYCGTVADHRQNTFSHWTTAHGNGEKFNLNKLGLCKLSFQIARDRAVSYLCNVHVRPAIFIFAMYIYYLCVYKHGNNNKNTTSTKYMFTCSVCRRVYLGSHCRQCFDRLSKLFIHFFFAFSHTHFHNTTLLCVCLSWFFCCF